MKPVLQKYIEGKITKKQVDEQYYKISAKCGGTLKGIKECLKLMGITLEQESLLCASPRAFWQEFDERKKAYAKGVKK